MLNNSTDLPPTISCPWDLGPSEAWDRRPSEDAGGLADEAAGCGGKVEDAHIFMVGVCFKLESEDNEKVLLDAVLGAPKGSSIGT